MSMVRQVLKNTGLLLIANSISMALMFFFNMYTARYLGAEGFGVLSFALAFTGIFIIFADFGLVNLTIREVARDKSLASKYIGNIIGIKIISVVFTFGMIVITINYLGYPEQTIYFVYIIAISVIFNSFTQNFYSIFRAFEKMEYVSIGLVLNSILLLFGALYMMKHNLGLDKFALLYLLVGTVTLGYSLIVLLSKFIFFKIEFDWRFWKQMIKKSLPFGLSAFLIITYYKIDTIMLSLMVSDNVVGWYNAAYNLIFALLLISGSIVGSIYPVMSKFHISSRDKLKYLYEISFKYLLIISLPITVATILLANRIILMIYGFEYVPSIIALQILILAIPIIFSTNLFGTLIASINKQTIAVKIVGASAIGNILMNLLLIPKYSYMGASIATVITEIIAFILCYRFISKFVSKIYLHKIIKQLLIPVISMSLFVLYFKQINLILLILSSIMIYVIMLYICGIFTSKEISLIKQIIKWEEK